MRHRVTAMALALLAAPMVHAVGPVAAEPAASRAQSAPPPLLDPAAEDMLEAPLANSGLELQERAGATNGLCATMRGLAELEEPRPDDIDEQLRWVTLYYGGLKLFDPSGRVTDPESGDKERVSDALVAAIATERRAIRALQQRIQYAQLLVDDDHVPREQLQPRLDYALVAFARSDYDRAHRQLLAAQRRYC